MAMRLLERLPRETGREYALRVIRENIIGLELAPGSLISENELAGEMGLSRTPVREALIELSKVKIVEISPQKKSAVVPIDCDLVEEAQFMRNVLEGAVVALACSTAGEGDLRTLTENVQLQNFYLENGYHDQLLALDDEFHRALFEITGKMQVYTMIQNFCIHLYRVRRISVDTRRDLKIVSDHTAILEAIRNRQPETARQVMEEHLGRYRVDTAAVRERFPEYFQ